LGSRETDCGALGNLNIGEMSSPAPPVSTIAYVFSTPVRAYLTSMKDEFQVRRSGYEISYRTVPKWFVPAIMAGTFSIGLLVVFGSAAYLLPLAPVARHILGSPELVMETFFRCICLLLLGFLTFLLAEICRHDRLVISKDGISFPVFLSPDLLFRRKRTWDDIGNIMLGAMLRQDKKGVYEYELEESRGKRKLFMYFKSGGHVCLDLTKMPKKNQEKLFQAIEDWCISCSRVPQSKHMREVRKRLAQSTTSEPVSYTRLWEEQLESYFSHTNFVPLERDEKIGNERFSILMQLASGGLSAVYLAEKTNKDLVVIKESSLPLTISEAQRSKAEELFKREARILLKLDHPQIAKIYDHFVERRRDYLVLEFIPGHTLRQLVVKKGLLDEQVAVGYVRQLAGVLDYLHGQSPTILHRDISPDNLVLKDDGTLVVIDFGAANEIVGTATGTLIGKQSYMSPEQFKGKPTVQSDLYAVGGCLYFMLTGQDPKPLTTSHPQELRPSVSKEVDRLVGELTNVAAEERTQSVEKLLERLEDLHDSFAATVKATLKANAESD